MFVALTHGAVFVVHFGRFLIARVRRHVRSDCTTCARMSLGSEARVAFLVLLRRVHSKSLSRFASDVHPSALFIELEDAATSAAAAIAGSDSRPSIRPGDERPRSAAVGGFWFGLDTRHVEDAPGVAVIKRQPGGLEPSRRRPLRAQLQVQSYSKGAPCWW